MHGEDTATKLDEAHDEALLVAFANGDAASGRALLERLAPRLFAHATRVLADRSEAEDVVQETMLRLWRIAPVWRSGEAKISTWAYRVLANLCTDRLRSRKKRPKLALDDVVEPASDTASVIERMTEVERARALDDALATLPDRQRQAVILRHIEGFSNPEIAAIMDIGVEAVESLTARGKRALAAVLAGRKDELGFGDG